MLDCADIPQPANNSDRHVRSQVTRRKISLSPRSDIGRDRRDAFLGLAKTCAKLGVAFWDCLGNRLGVSGQLSVPPLAEIIRCGDQPA